MEGDEWDFWRKSLNGEHPEIHEGEPHIGYYSVQKSKAYPPLPVAVFLNRGTGDLSCMVGYRSLYELRDPYQEWTWIANRPISYEVYEEVTQTHQWPESGSSEYGRLLAVLNTAIGVPDYDGGELESLWARFEQARKKETSKHLREKRMIDARYHEVQTRIKSALKELKQREEA
jgi:hypothetical protein